MSATNRKIQLDFKKRTHVNRGKESNRITNCNQDGNQQNQKQEFFQFAILQRTDAFHRKQVNQLVLQPTLLGVQITEREACLWDPTTPLP